MGMTVRSILAEIDDYKKARGEYSLFMDADFSTSLVENVIPNIAKQEQATINTGTKKLLIVLPFLFLPKSLYSFGLNLSINNHHPRLSLSYTL